jgi:hypothetical protein
LQLSIFGLEQPARKRAFSKSQIGNRQSQIKMSAVAKATARQPSLYSTTRAKTGGKGIRTPDFQLAKLALYQLSYAPKQNFRISIADFRLQGIKQNAGCRSRRVDIRHAVFLLSALM